MKTLSFSVDDVSTLSDDAALRELFDRAAPSVASNDDVRAAEDRRAVDGPSGGNQPGSPPGSPSPLAASPDGDGAPVEGEEPVVIGEEEGGGGAAALRPSGVLHGVVAVKNEIERVSSGVFSVVAEFLTSLASSPSAGETLSGPSSSSPKKWAAPVAAAFVAVVLTLGLEGMGEIHTIREENRMMKKEIRRVRSMLLGEAAEAARYRAREDRRAAAFEGRLGRLEAEIEDATLAIKSVPSPVVGAVPSPAEFDNFGKGGAMLSEAMMGQIIARLESTASCFSETKLSPMTGKGHNATEKHQGTEDLVLEGNQEKGVGPVDHLSLRIVLWWVFALGFLAFSLVFLMGYLVERGLLKKGGGNLPNNDSSLSAEDVAAINDALTKPEATIAMIPPETVDEGTEIAAAKPPERESTDPPTEENGEGAGEALSKGPTGIRAVTHKANSNRSRISGKSSAKAAKKVRISYALTESPRPGVGFVSMVPQGFVEALESAPIGQVLASLVRSSSPASPEGCTRVWSRIAPAILWETPGDHAEARATAIEDGYELVDSKWLDVANGGDDKEKLKGLTVAEWAATHRPYLSTSGRPVRVLDVIVEVRPSLESPWPRASLELPSRLRVGDFVDAKDSSGRWYEAVVRFVDAHKVKVHYIGWSSKWDAWIPKSDEEEDREDVAVALSRSDGRVGGESPPVPLWSKTPRWRDNIEVGDVVEVREAASPADHPRWFRAVVRAVGKEDDMVRGLEGGAEVEAREHEGTKALLMLGRKRQVLVEVPKERLEGGGLLVGGADAPVTAADPPHLRWVNLYGEEIAMANTHNRHS